MKKTFLTLAALFLLSSTSVYAEPTAFDAAVGAAPAAASAATAPGAPVAAAEETGNDFTGSFFLTPLEIAAIQQALKGKVTKAQTLQGQNAASVPAHRIIRISGVFYRSPVDWVVWMNNQKVTPGNLLPEIIDINVKPSSKVSLEWYDVGLNQVLSITLRPHQTYDITTGILLPQ